MIVLVNGVKPAAARTVRSTFPDDEPARAWFDRLLPERQTRHVPGRQPPPPYRTVTPRMFVDDVDETVAFLRAVFDATAEIEPGRPTDVHIGGSVVLVSSASERGPFPAFLYVYVDDADATYRRAVRAGSTSIEEPLDTPYGDRRAMFSDASGNVYQVAHRHPDR